MYFLSNSSGKKVDAIDEPKEKGMGTPFPSSDTYVE